MSSDSVKTIELTVELWEAIKGGLGLADRESFVGGYEVTVAIAALKSQSEQLRDERAELWPKAQVLPTVQGELEYANGRSRTLAERIERARNALLMGGQSADIRCRAALAELEDVPL